MWLIRLAFLSFIALTLQTSNEVWNFLSIYDAKPDFRLVLLFWVAQRRGPIWGMFFGFLMGLSLDVYAIDHLGASAMAGCVMGYLLGLIEEKTFHLNFLARIILLILSTLMFNLLYLLALRKGQWSLLWDSYIDNGLSYLLTVLLGGFFIYIFHSRLTSKNEF